MSEDKRNVIDNNADFISFFHTAITEIKKELIEIESRQDKISSLLDKISRLEETIGTTEDFANPHDKYKTGDKIKIVFAFAKKERHMATAVQQQGGNMLFVLDDYLDEPFYMNQADTNWGRYNKSDMRKHLQKVAEGLSEEFKSMLVPFENGDLLRLLTITELFGLDSSFNNRREGQILYFKDRENRIASRKGESECGWTATAVEINASRFVLVTGDGSMSAYDASCECGVRPAFLIKNF